MHVNISVLERDLNINVAIYFFWRWSISAPLNRQNQDLIDVNLIKSKYNAIKCKTRCWSLPEATSH